MTQVPPEGPSLPASHSASLATPQPTIEPGQWREVPRRAAFDRAKWLPTIAVAAVIGATVLGGIGIDGALAEPAARGIGVGNGLEIEAPPGWIVQRDPSVAGVRLQNGNAVLLVESGGSFEGEPHTLIEQFVENSQAGGEPGAAAQIDFGPIEDRTLGGNAASAVSFTAVTSNGVIDGEEVVVVRSGSVVYFQAQAPQGYFARVADDVTSIAASVSEAAR